MEALMILYLISWSMLMITVLWQLPSVFYRWAKIVTAALFVLISLYNENPVIILTLVLFFIGDVYLAFADGGKVKRWLLVGMFFFWLGHLGLIFCMLNNWVFNGFVLTYALIPMVLLMFIKYTFSRIDFRGMYKILLMYGYTLGILGSMSLMSYDAHSLLTYGIMIFIVSDLCLIFWYFYPDCPRWVKVINVLAYFGSVLIIALS